ncbi:unnamed protein product [Rotaria sp. Silwood2]|nr:unnamed protein product [Rotaria sp. Silwood2]CAF2908747.1 unnamed protein product [Rotaria sp. Silwood2]CAF4185084.1 unnamed protein product [Rotaria sp. Silwood2]CAF4550420.1 unnamed protein product [Rotaria sp. Silwood2]
MKTLEPDQISLLLNNKGCEHALYLSYICENLRQFGDYSLVTNRLTTYPQTIEELLNVLLNEVYAIIDNQSLVDAFFKLLIISTVGILESDIVNLLQHFMNKTTDENNQILINRMIWSTLQRHMKTFLDTTWMDGHQLVIYRHASIEQILRKRCLKENADEIRSLNSFMAQFYHKYSTIKDFSFRRIPYHYEQAHMYKELVAYLRSSESRGVSRTDRQAYLRRRRCTKQLSFTDDPFNQRAYLCHICAMQFKLGPYTMAKSSCLICTNMIMGGNMTQTNALRREARVCQKHGSIGYPHSIQCIICKSLRPKVTGTAPSVTDPVPLNICFDCWFAGGAIPRCCGFELE